eukprot:875970-Rhodomonas_salina.1
MDTQSEGRGDRCTVLHATSAQHALDVVHGGVVRVEMLLWLVHLRLLGSEGGDQLELQGIEALQDFREPGVDSHASELDGLTLDGGVDVQEAVLVGGDEHGEAVSRGDGVAGDEAFKGLGVEHAVGHAVTFERSGFACTVDSAEHAAAFFLSVARREQEIPVGALAHTDHGLDEIPVAEPAVFRLQGHIA